MAEWSLGLTVAAKISLRSICYSTLRFIMKISLYRAMLVHTRTKLLNILMPYQIFDKLRKFYSSQTTSNHFSMALGCKMILI